MNRVEAIERYAQRKEKEETKKKNATMDKVEAYKAQVRALQPRIAELIEVGNACLKHGIPLEYDGLGREESYENHQFISNGFSHLVGFIGEGKTALGRKPFKMVGKVGGGACDYNLATDGVTMEVSGRVEDVLKMFLDGFDKFETEFYKYVDSVTAE